MLLAEAMLASNLAPPITPKRRLNIRISEAGDPGRRRTAYPRPCVFSARSVLVFFFLGSWSGADRRTAFSRLQYRPSFPFSHKSCWDRRRNDPGHRLRFDPGPGDREYRAGVHNMSRGIRLLRCEVVGCTIGAIRTALGYQHVDVVA